MDSVAAMRIFVRVAELSSFSQAALSLGLPKASVSTAVQGLENRLGTRLLHRTTRRVRLTPDGQVYYERSKDLLSDMEELEGLFRSGPADLQGRLRVDLPARMARSLVLPRLPEFMATHPRLVVEFSSTDRLVDLVREGFDCVLRVGEMADSSLVGRRLGVLRQINCASPKYLASRGRPTVLADLERHQLIHYVTTLGGKSPGFEYVDDSGGQTRTVAMGGNLSVNNSDAYEAACLAGLGIIQAPETGLREHIENGRLVEILPEYRAAPLPVTLLYGNRRHLPRRVREFMTWIGEVLGPYLVGV